jgi:signal peptidase I
VLGEFAMTRGGWESVRWAAGGLRTVWQEHRERIRQLPRYERRGRRVAVAAVLMVLLAVPIRMFVLSAAYIPSGAMEPALQVGDRWMIDKLSWRITGINRDDIITYTATNEPGTTPARSTRVQRVIGLPGDTIECRGQQIFRNGAALEDPWSPPNGVEQPVPDVKCAPVTVPPDSLYLVGDFWLVAQDSRLSGPVPMDAVEARLLFRLWPLSR